MTSDVRIVQELCAMLAATSPAGTSPHVLCALSGGKDSVGLLATLAETAEHKRHYTLCAGYVNHSAQEQSAQAREFETVRSVCASLDIPLCALSLCGIEPCAPVSEAYLRERRYEALCAMARACKATHIVTAHHQGDVYESVLMRLLTHGAWQGLSGIPSMRKIRCGYQDIFVLRPALQAQPALFHSQQLPHHADASNADTRYKRNALRNQVIPVIEKHFPQANERVNAFAHAQCSLRTFVESTIPPWLVAHEHIVFSFSVFAALSRVQQNHVLCTGANKLGIPQLTHTFLEACRKSLLHDMSSICIKNTLLVKRGKSLVWKIFSTGSESVCANDYASKMKTFPVHERCSLVYTNNGSWVVSAADELQKGDCISYSVSIIPPVHIAFLKKSDIIVQGSKKLNVLSMLRVSSQMWQSIPVICDREGIVCVAGESLLNRTLCRTYKQQSSIDDTIKLYAISIAYRAVEVAACHHNND